jgi:hypothetical protein
MSLRISSALVALAVLAGCGAESPAPAGDKIACAIGAEADFAEVCTLERVAGSTQIVLHHPDGGFRRMSLDPASGALAPLDGAEPMVIDEGQGFVQFAIGPDRYRITREAPATPTP